MEYTPRYLVMVTGDSNHNKYYKQIPNEDGSWTAEYGRVGSSPQRRNYSFSSWESKYNEKVKKGYVDQTDLVKDLINVKTSKSETEYADIENKAIAEIVQRLQSYADAHIKANYMVSSNAVTQAMVDAAQEILDGLINIKNLEDFNSTLLKLFNTIPRKMSDVKLFLASRKEDFSNIIQREQNTLDVMRGQVVQHVVEEDTEEIEKKSETILEVNGLIFDECDDKDIIKIKSLLGSCADKFKAAWRVTNLSTQKRYDEFVEVNHIKNEKLLWHGSRNENWWSIINTGLVLRPTNAVITGKMFGYGIYYAPKARKSLGYTSLSGSYWARGNSNSAFMAVMQVAYGKPYDVYSFNNNFNSLNYKSLQNMCPGANSLHAHEGSMLRNDEIVVYKEDQCTIKYLVELRN